PIEDDAVVGDANRTVFDGRAADWQDNASAEDHGNAERKMKNAETNPNCSRSAFNSSFCIPLLPSLQIAASWRRRLVRAASLCQRSRDFLCRLRICCSIFFATRSMAA